MRQAREAARAAGINASPCYIEIMLALDLPREVEERLIAATSRAGQTKEAWAADAIVELLDDEEDYRIAIEPALSFVLNNATLLYFLRVPRKPEASCVIMGVNAAPLPLPPIDTANRATPPRQLTHAN